MIDFLRKLACTLDRLARSEDGQDMIEYALVVALLSLGATAGMSSLATGINHAFGNVSTILQDNITSIVL